MKSRARTRGTVFAAALVFFCAGAGASFGAESESESKNKASDDGQSLSLVEAVTTSRDDFFSLSRERDADRSPLHIQRIYDDAFDRPSKGLFNTVGVGVFAVAVGDLLSTEIGLTRPGVVEVNPTQSNRLARVGTHVAIPAFLWWMTERAHDQGRTKLALAMRLGCAIAYGYATLHNLRAMAGQP
jgi:hypothetical protein